MTLDKDTESFSVSISLSEKWESPPFIWQGFSEEQRKPCGGRALSHELSLPCPGALLVRSQLWSKSQGASLPLPAVFGLGATPTPASCLLSSELPQHILQTAAALFGLSPLVLSSGVGRLSTSTFPGMRVPVIPKPSSLLARLAPNSFRQGVWE